MSEKKPYKIGLALSGGGARGFAHVGALYAMDELGIKPDIIAGVSAGSIAGSMYSAGLKPLEIMKLFMKAKFTDFCEISVPKDGFFRMNGFRSFLTKSLGVELIEQCSTPLVVCATDLDNCCPVQWREGAIAERVMASCSIPIVFQPVKIDGLNYVDGGVLHNLPAWAIRDDCDYLIGINCSPMVKKNTYKGTLLDVAQRSYMLMAKTNAIADMHLCDLVIETKSIADMHVFNMHQKELVFRSGSKAARDAIKKAGLV